MRQEDRRTRLLYALLLVLGVVACALGVYLTGQSLGPLDGFMARWAVLVLEVGGAIACIARPILVRKDRKAWTCLAAAVAAWAIGDAYFRVVLFTADGPVIPSPADVCWLAFYPLAYAGIALLIRERVRDLRVTVWIDGVIAALAVSAVTAAVVFDAVLASVGGAPLQTATDLAYPLGDGLLMGLLVAAFAMIGWRYDRSLFLLGASLGAFAVSDCIYLSEIAAGTYTAGSPLDAGWALALLMAGVAATATARQGSPARRTTGTSWRSIVLPIALAGVALAIESYDHFVRVTALAIALAGACLVAVLARLAVTFAQNVSMLNVSREEAATDPVTGLGNRRKLAIDLEEALGRPATVRGQLLILFDLNGFKLYNDTFGHPAGDSLLARLGTRLASEVGSRGAAYRMGGDEFCVLLAPGDEAPSTVAWRCAATLQEPGEGISIDCAHGWALLPADAASPDAAMRLVDRRMYANKESARGSTQAQTRDVLLQTLVERSPDLEAHLGDVAKLAVITAQQLGIDGAQLEQIRSAAQLHDIGKVAIPDAILHKPDTLDATEWEYIKRHSEVGERIVAAAPALAGVATLVRSIHERIDGAGYPDGLAGDEIPLGARVITACDAFDAMTKDRPYRRRLDEPSALRELRRNAGTQFDRDVIEAFAIAQRSLEQPAAHGLGDGRGAVRDAELLVGVR